MVKVCRRLRRGLQMRVVMTSQCLSEGDLDVLNALVTSTGEGSQNHESRFTIKIIHTMEVGNRED